MPKERSVNPAQAQRKAEKAKAVKKGTRSINNSHLHLPLQKANQAPLQKTGKAETQARRNEKLARRNPERLQKQLDELKALESSGGRLTSHEKSVLEGLERDLKAVKKAREALGEKAPRFGREGGDGSGTHRRGSGGFAERGGRGGGVLGKRRRRDGSEDDSEDGSDVPEDVRRIPMPRDTPPPIPKDVLDRWYAARRERMGRAREEGRGTNANNTPLGQNDRRARHLDGLPDRPSSGGQGAVQVPVLEAKTVYEAKPVVRDLRKEAVSFVPAAVRLKMEKGKGLGGLVEPEEADRLEREGYMGVRRDADGEDRDDHGEATTQASKAVVMEEVEDEDD